MSTLALLFSVIAIIAAIWFSYSAWLRHKKENCIFLKVRELDVVKSTVSKMIR
jgi:hypothetical protein